MIVAKGVQRWVVDISKWIPSVNHLFSLIFLLPRHEHSSINRLLHYAIVHQILGIPFDEIVNGGGKTLFGALNPRLVMSPIDDHLSKSPPVLFSFSFWLGGSNNMKEMRINFHLMGKQVCEKTEIGFPNFNFNASRHGDYVAIASEPYACLEWYHIITAGSSDEKLKIFYRYWCLKEACVKSLGTGVGYKLDDVEFHHTGLEKHICQSCRKRVERLEILATRTGPTSFVIHCQRPSKNSQPSYMSTLKQTEFDKDVYHVGLRLPNSSFIFLTMEDLIPVQCKPDRLSLDLSKNHLEFKHGDYDENARFKEL